eukprot:GHVU01166175.1.p1 GENE.GHVU01166175.1~~GHVU01166175.1.p1  ORF type:complete len:235 (-),score=43.27 GHVU01166175.1:107-811(-)
MTDFGKKLPIIRSLDDFLLLEKGYNLTVSEYDLQTATRCFAALQASAGQQSEGESSATGGVASSSTTTQEGAAEREAKRRKLILVPPTVNVQTRSDATPSNVPDKPGQGSPRSNDLTSKDAAAIKDPPQQQTEASSHYRHHLSHHRHLHHHSFSSTDRAPLVLLDHHIRPEICYRDHSVPLMVCGHRVYFDCLDEDAAFLRAINDKLPALGGGGGGGAGGAGGGGAHRVSEVGE